MLGCNRLNGLGAYYTAGGYYYDNATGKALYSSPVQITGIPTSIDITPQVAGSTSEAGQEQIQRSLIAQSEQPVYTDNPTQLANQGQLITASEQPASSGGGVVSSGAGNTGGTRSPGVPLLTFGPSSGGASHPPASSLTTTQQAIAAGYTPTQWAALTPAQRATALQQAGYGSTSVGPAGSLASLFSNPTALLVIGAVVIIAMAAGKK